MRCWILLKTQKNNNNCIIQLLSSCVRNSSLKSMSLCIVTQITAAWPWLVFQRPWGRTPCTTGSTLHPRCPHRPCPHPRQSLDTMAEVTSYVIVCQSVLWLFPIVCWISGLFVHLAASFSKINFGWNTFVCSWKGIQGCLVLGLSVCDFVEIFF